MATKLNISQAMRKLGIFNDYYNGKLTEEEIKKRRREDLRAKHPDKGGDANEFAEANACWDRVMQYFEQKKAEEANKCETCDGSGWVEKPSGGFIQNVKCPKCKGRGVKNV